MGVYYAYIRMRIRRNTDTVSCLALLHTFRDSRLFFSYTYITTSYKLPHTHTHAVLWFRSYGSSTLRIRNTTSFHVCFWTASWGRRLQALMCSNDTSRIIAQEVLPICVASYQNSQLPAIKDTTTSHATDVSHLSLGSIIFKDYFPKSVGAKQHS